MYVWGKLHWGSKPGWHNKPPPQTEPLLLQNNVSMAKRLPTALSSSAKKLRNLTLTPQYRAKQFPNDLCVVCVSGELLFCKFCQHSVDWKCKNTCNDPVLSKSHVRNKEKYNDKSSKVTSLQTCITASTFKSSDSRKEFVEDFVAMCAEADTSIEEM